MLLRIKWKVAVVPEQHLSCKVWTFKENLDDLQQFPAFVVVWTYYRKPFVVPGSVEVGAEGSKLFTITAPIMTGPLDVYIKNNTEMDISSLTLPLSRFDVLGWESFVAAKLGTVEFWNIVPAKVTKASAQGPAAAAAAAAPAPAPGEARPAPLGDDAEEVPGIDLEQMLEDATQHVLHALG